MTANHDAVVALLTLDQDAEPGRLEASAVSPPIGRSSH
jgi:hypothetical protein